MDFDVFKAKLKSVFDFLHPATLSRTPITLDPSKGDLALLLIDVQKEFADPAQERGNHETRQVSRRINSLIPAFRAAGLPAYVVYFDEDNRKPEDIDFYLFRPSAGDKLIAKDDDSAFRGSDIKSILRRDKRKTLLACGFNLNACVYKTVMDARSNGFNVVLLRDLTGNDKENDNSDTDERLKRMQKKGVKVMNSLDLLESISGFRKDKPLPKPQTAGPVQPLRRVRR